MAATVQFWWDGDAGLDSPLSLIGDSAGVLGRCTTLRLRRRYCDRGRRPHRCCCCRSVSALASSISLTRRRRGGLGNAGRVFARRVTSGYGTGTRLFTVWTVSGVFDESFDTGTTWLFLATCGDWLRRRLCPRLPAGGLEQRFEIFLAKFIQIMKLWIFLRSLHRALYRSVNNGHL